MRPEDLFDRDAEWADLERFADAVGSRRGLAPGRLHVDDWNEALHMALGGPDALLIIDELPYLMATVEGRVIPSVLQSLIDQSHDRPAHEDRRGRQALAQAEATPRTQIHGPAFEQVAREWVARHTSPDTLGEAAGLVGTTVVNDSRGRSQYEVDVVALPVGQGMHDPHARILALGETKDSDGGRPLSDLHRLETIRDLRVRRGYRAEEARLLVFGRSGFDAALADEASGRADVQLVGLERLRSGE